MREHLSSDGGLQHAFTPLPQLVGVVLAGSRFPIVEPLAFGTYHICHALGHGLGHAASNELLLIGVVVGSHALPQGFPEDSRYHRCYVLEGQVFRT